MSLTDSSHSVFDNGFITGSIYENPYPIYNTLRRECPVHWSNHKQTWVVTKYTDVDFGLRDLRLSVKRDGVQLGALSDDEQRELTLLKRFYSLWLMYQDPPNHTRTKKAVSKAFTPKAIEEQIPFIKDTVADTIHRIKDQNSMEVLHDFANPLSLSIVAGTLGIPTKDYSLIEEWSGDIVNFMQGRIDSLLEGARKAHQAIEELQSYLNTLFSKHRQTAEGDLISQLMLAKQQEILSEEEIVATYANVVIDGHEPIANAIANGLLALLQNFDQLQELRENPDLMDTAIEELLRYDPPFQYSVRHALEPIEIQGQQIEKGQRVLLMLASANRDEEIFVNAETLDITRDSGKQRAFGFRTHFCLGATLARPMLELVFRSLLKEIPDMRLSEQKLERYQGLGSRGLKSLNVEW